MPELSEYDCIIRFANGVFLYQKYSDFTSLYPDYIILDSISNKIYRQGRALDSKDIVSQTYTISLFAKLIDNLNNRVNNQDLEVSAYSKSMNQFSGKILSPLKKVTEDLL